MFFLMNLMVSGSSFNLVLEKLKQILNFLFIYFLFAVIFCTNLSALLLFPVSSHLVFVLQS